jgi:SnoaL-like protein
VTANPHDEEEPMTHDEVQHWLDAYSAAWDSYDPAAIAELFAADATSKYHPYDLEPTRGREAIVADWLENRDDVGTYEGRYEPYAVDGDRAVAIGESRYRNADGTPRTMYYNVFLLRFDEEGRCAEFTEYYMELPERLRSTQL